MQIKHNFTTSIQFGNYLAAILLAAVPFHAFLTVWGASLVGGYTVLRLWSAFILTACAGLLGYWWWRDATLRAWMRSSLTVRLITVYAVLHIILTISAVLRGNVTTAAAAYALLINGRFLVFFVFVMALMRYSGWLRQRWPGLVLIPAMVVALGAILQYNVLPPDFLRHFGYGPHTIESFETINNNPAYIRVQSTLRGANPLGAYMVMVLGLLAAQWRGFAKRSQLAMYIASASLALLFSFSRSAWIGSGAALLVVAALSVRTAANRWRLTAIIAGIVIITGVVLFSFGSNTALQNALFHTEDRSKVAISSNDQRETALRSGWRDVSHEALGRGPGTAGPASVHNTGHPARLAENYFLQIGQETGWMGMLLFIAICTAVAYRLWLQRSGQLALGLLAAFVGLTLVNLLSHAWTDDTLAFTWWGLAAIALTPQTQRSKTLASAQDTIMTPTKPQPGRQKPHKRQQRVSKPNQ